MSDSMAKLVGDVKQAIQAAQSRLDGLGLAVRKMELELKTTASRSAGGELKLVVIPLGLSGQATQTDVQTVSLSLVPRPARVELLGSVQDELVEAIETIGEVMRQAAASEPAFDLDGATVALSFGVEKDGKIAIFVSGRWSSETTHGLKLTLGRA